MSIMGIKLKDFIETVTKITLYSAECPYCGNAVYRDEIKDVKMFKCVECDTLIIVEREATK